MCFGLHASITGRAQTSTACAFIWCSSELLGIGFGSQAAVGRVSTNQPNQSNPIQTKPNQTNQPTNQPYQKHRFLASQYSKIANDMKPTKRVAPCRRRRNFAQSGEEHWGGAEVGAGHYRATRPIGGAVREDSDLHHETSICLRICVYCPVLILKGVYHCCKYVFSA